MDYQTKRWVLTGVEVIAISSMLLLTVNLFLPNLTICKTSATRIKCISNLKNLGLAARIYATENDGLMPGAFFRGSETAMARAVAAQFMRKLSNQLITPNLLLCPSDKARVANGSPASFAPTYFSNKNLSYFASVTAEKSNPEVILAGDRNLQFGGNPISTGRFTISSNTPRNPRESLSWSTKLHNQQGNVAMTDGSVQQASSARLQHMATKQGVATNRLLIP